MNIAIINTNIGIATFENFSIPSFTPDITIIAVITKTTNVQIVGSIGFETSVPKNSANPSAGISLKPPVIDLTMYEIIQPAITE